MNIYIKIAEYGGIGVYSIGLIIMLFYSFSLFFDKNVKSTNGFLGLILSALWPLFAIFVAIKNYRAKNKPLQYVRITRK